MIKALNYIGIARKAGALITGEEKSGAEIRAGHGKLLVLASDASENAAGRAEGFVRGTKVPLARLPITKEELSDASGRPGCSMMVFTDIGLASSFASALEQEYGETYAGLSESLKDKRDKMEKRRKEARAHERNRKLGKRRKTHEQF